MHKKTPQLTVHVLEPHRLVRSQLRALRITLALRDSVPSAWAKAYRILDLYDEIIAEMPPELLDHWHVEMRRQAKYLLDEVRHGR